MKASIDRILTMRFGGLPLPRTAANRSLLAAVLLGCALIAQTPGGVEGVVVDSKTGIPVAGVSVYFGSEKGPRYETETDPSGRFRVAGMADGYYGCHFEKDGYIAQYSGNLNSPLNPVHIVTGQGLVRLTVALSSYANLRGRVLDPEGKVVAHAEVALGRLEETTDEKGQFAFSKITPGSYILKASPDSGQVPGAAQKVELSTEERTALLPTWYPSVAQANLAEPVAIRSGDDLFGIDIRLQSLPVYRVRGQVFNIDGKPVPLANIRSFSTGDFASTVSGIVAGRVVAGDQLGYFALYPSLITLSDGEPGSPIHDGSFELKSVPRGLRQFRVTTDSDTLRASITVSVVIDHDVDDFEIRLEPTTTIEARLELANTPDDKIPAPIRIAPVRIIGSGAIGSRSRRLGNGFRFENVAPGEIRIDAPPGLAGGYYLSSVTLGGHDDITWKSFDIHAGTPPIIATYKPNAGTVTGDVESANAGSVVLIPRAAVDDVEVRYGRATPGR